MHPVCLKCRDGILLYSNICIFFLFHGNSQLHEISRKTWKFDDYMRAENSQAVADWCLWRAVISSFEGLYMLSSHLWIKLSLHLDSCYDGKIILNEAHKRRGGCDIFPVSIFVQSQQMRRWISSTVWTTVARQPPTLTTLPRRAPLAPPILLPTHTCTHTLTRINTLPLCQPPARTRLPKHTGPTGTHTHTPCLSVQPPLPSAPSTIIHLMSSLPFPLTLYSFPSLSLPS